MLPNAPEPATLDQQQILDALKRLSDGDLSVQLPTGQGGTAGEIADTFNSHVHMLNNFASELTRVAREMGTDGRYGPQAEVAGLAGFWKLMVDEVNVMAAQLTNQIRDIGNVARASSPQSGPGGSQAMKRLLARPGYLSRPRTRRSMRRFIVS